MCEVRPIRERTPIEMNTYNVRYARVVIMETEVQAESRDDVYGLSLPGVYEGIENIPPQMMDIVDYDVIWEVTLKDEEE